MNQNKLRREFKTKGLTKKLVAGLNTAEWVFEFTSKCFSYWSVNWIQLFLTFHSLTFFFLFTAHSIRTNWMYCVVHRIIHFEIIFYKARALRAQRAIFYLIFNGKNFSFYIILWTKNHIKKVHRSDDVLLQKKYSSVVFCCALYTTEQKKCLSVDGKLQFFLFIVTENI